MDYDCGGSRKTKKDLKRKRQFRVFKRGGIFRTSNGVSESTPSKK